MSLLAGANHQLIEAELTFVGCHPSGGLPREANWPYPSWMTADVGKPNLKKLAENYRRTWEEFTQRQMP